MIKDWTKTVILFTNGQFLNLSIFFDPDFISWVVNKRKNCGHTRQELRKLYHKRQPQVSKASAGKKVISFPLTVNLLEDGQGVTDITGPLLLLRPLGYAVDAETEGH